MASKWRAITACTPDYADEVARLSASCIKHGVTLTVYPYKDKESWILNCEHTVQVMRDALEDSPRINVVWLDADSVVNDYPSLFDDFPHDIGVYKRKNTAAYVKRHQDNSGVHYESGTIFLRNNKRTRAFIHMQLARLLKYDEARKLNAVTPMKLPDYPSLNHLLRDCDLDIGLLPVAYHCPMNNPQPEEVCDSPVIIQDMVGSFKRRGRMKL